MKRILTFAALIPCVAFCTMEVVETPRGIPLVRTTDVLVVGGSSAGVTAAVAARKAGANVFLVAPRPYLGEDIAGTLRLALEGDERPETALAQDIWLDREIDLPFTYVADAPSVAPHKDTGRLLCDGTFDDAISGSVQFDVPKVKIDLTLPRATVVEALELVTYRRYNDFGVVRPRLVTSVDGKTWSAPKNLALVPSAGGGHEYARWRVELNREVRRIGLAAFRAPGCKRMLLGEITLKAKGKEGRLRVPTPIQVKQAFDRELLSNDVAFLTGSYVTDILRDGAGDVSGVVIANRSGRQAIRAKTIIDATERATVARLAGVPFTVYPKGPAIFTRVVISGTAPTGEGLRVRALPGDYSTAIQWARRGRTVPGRAWECTLEIPMADGSYASFAEAEQIARDSTFTKAQLDAADTLFQVPPDRATGAAAHVFILGGCAGLDAAALRPLAFMKRGEEVGRRAAADARERAAISTCSVVGDRSAAPGGKEIREALNGLRPFDSNLPTVPSAAHGIPVLGEYDVVVVGGGTGGAPAGIGAARQGAKTLLVEYLYGLGGVGTLGMIGKYWYGNPVGFTAEHDRGVAALGAEVRACGKREWWRAENRRAGTTLWFGAMACGAVVEKGRVCGVVVATPQGRGVVLAKNVVDATGNADVAAAAGARCEFIGAGEIALQGAGLSEKTLGASYINSDWGYVNDSDAQDLWLFGLRGRLGAGRVWDVSQVVETRERRRIIGAGTVTPLDLLNHRTFPDTIIQGRSDFDSHGPSVDDVCYVSEAVTNKVFWANMPYRSLIPETVDGIAVAGIGISVHRDALPLLRMQPEVQNAGYAAGTAAAMAGKTGVELRDLDVKALQRHLVDLGAIPEEVLHWTDNARVDDETWLLAVKNLANDYAGVSLVLADRARALPALRDAYEKATTPSAKLIYAHVLGILGDATGAETLARQIDGRDDEIRLNPKGLPAFGRRMSERDSFIVALGRTKSPLAVKPLIAELEKVNGRTSTVHVRALALACEQVANPVLAPALATALKKDGIGGWARPGATAVTPAGGFCSSPEFGRCLRELNLARALLACGDSNGLARKTFEAYAADARGVLALHARACLDAVKK
ncbi:MAG: FAD-dependent oxidoreductase [Kiritimatiellia bacterium]